MGRKHNKKNVVPNVTHNDGLVGLLPSRDSVATDDFELQQAIALSLGKTYPAKELQSKQESSHPIQTQSGRSFQRNTAIEVTPLRPTRRKNQHNVLTFTGEEFDVLFLNFLGARQAHITFKDLERVSAAHDFIWDEDQIQDMINFFDTDMDGQLQGTNFGLMIQPRTLHTDTRLQDDIKSAFILGSSYRCTKAHD